MTSSVMSVCLRSFFSAKESNKSVDTKNLIDKVRLQDKIGKEANIKYDFRYVHRAY